MVDISAYADGSTRIETADHAEWIEMIAAAREAGGDVTVMTGEQAGTHVARIRYPDDGTVAEESSEAPTSSRKGKAKAEPDPEVTE